MTHWQHGRCAGWRNGLREESKKFTFTVRPNWKNTGLGMIQEIFGFSWRRRTKPLIQVESGIAAQVRVSFVLNDLRDATYDSRTWGPVFENTITGIPMFRVWPFGRVDTID